MIPNKFDALIALVGGQITLQDGSSPIYHDGQTPPTEAEIDAEIIRLKAEYDAQEYARNRKEEYDSLNQFEMQYDDEEDGTTTWKDAIDAIKTKYPKG
jgi:hypothetical protein